MRSVWLGNRLEFDFDGKVLDGAVTLGDIDNDGEWELVVGSASGDLSVFKGGSLWQKIGGLGAIASVAVGDVMNCGSNAVLIVGTDGTCTVYLCLNNAGEKLRVVHKQTLAPNAKCVTVGDAMGDGQTYMVLGFSDCTVRLYKWVQNPTEACLTCLSEVKCTAQIGSICVSKDECDSSLVYIAQPGTGFLTAEFKEKGKVSVKQHEVNISKSLNVTVPSQLATSVGRNGSTVLSCIDGTVLFVNADKSVKWSLALEQQAFKCLKIHASPDRRDQVVVATWSGHTFIINKEGETVLFELNSPIQNFAAGAYGGRGTTAFVYLTFSNKIIICLDVMIEDFSLKSSFMYQTVDPTLSSYSREELKKLTQYLLYDFPKRQ